MRKFEINKRMADFDTWKIIDNFTDCSNQYLIMNAFYRIMAAVMIAGVTLASCEVQGTEPDDNGQPPVDNVEPDIQAGEDGVCTKRFSMPTCGRGFGNCSRISCVTR